MSDVQLPGVSGGRAAWIEPLRRRAETLFWERRLAIATRSGGGTESDEHCAYVTIPYRVIFMVLDRLELGPADVFVDLGCGRGRVVCCAARFALAGVVGVEDVPELAQDAQRNLSRMRGARCARREVVCAKAQDFNYEGVTAMYMFHPFGGQILEQVLDRLKASLDARPRPLRLAYVNPIHDSVIEAAGWLERYCS